MFGLGSSLGSGTLMNALMYNANKDGLSGKKLYIAHRFGGIQWDELRPELVEECFSRNDIYVLTDDETEWLKLGTWQITGQ